MRIESLSNATVRDVAAAAGVSLRTVCRVLNGSEDALRAETRTRVLAAAEKLRYVPNASAKAVRRGHSGGIALLLSSDLQRSYLPEALLDGIQEKLRAHDLHMTVAAVPDPQLTDEAVVPKFLRQWMADGLLVNYTIRIPPALVSRIERLRIPAVWINIRRKTDCVYIDDFHAARRLTEYLWRLGHRRIAYVDYHNDLSAPQDWHYSAVDRCRGYEQAMATAGLTARVLRQDGQLPVRRKIEAAVMLLKAPDRPTAIITYSPGRTTLPIHLAAVAHCGLRVPEDLSLTTFSPFAEDDVGVAMTKMLLPEREMGREAVAMLLRKIGRRGAQPSRCLAATLVEGESTAPPPRERSKGRGERVDG
ncbi:MAG: LacI family DNA-binding transcriptional regulator [bacterium]